MPIYEYECVGCGKLQELYFKHATGGLTAVHCDECGNMAKRVLSWVHHIGKEKGRFPGGEPVLGEAPQHRDANEPHAVGGFTDQEKKDLDIIY